MDFVTIFIGLAMLAAAFPFVMKPLTKKSGKKQNRTVEKEDPHTRKIATYAAIRDLDFDFQTGKVTDEDYQLVRAQLVNEAAQLVDSAPDKGDEVEAMIASYKTQQSSKAACSNCGEKMESGSRFCPKCGTAAGTSCPACGRAVNAGDLFCTACGAKVNISREAVA